MPSNAANDNPFNDDAFDKMGGDLSDPNSEINKQFAQIQAEFDDPNSALNKMSAEFNDPNSEINKQFALMQAELDNPNSALNKMRAELDDPNSEINKQFALMQVEFDNPNSALNRILDDWSSTDLVDFSSLAITPHVDDGEQVPEPDPNLTTQDVAGWMLQYIEAHDQLYQSTAAYYIVQHFGERFTYRNVNGNLAISRDVLKEFLRLTRDTVVWSRRQRYWRHRLPSDPEGVREVE